jgi:hypothetical protein
MNYVRTISTDEGKSWSYPTFVNAGSARPRLLASTLDDKEILIMVGSACASPIPPIFCVLFHIACEGARTFLIACVEHLQPFADYMVLHTHGHRLQSGANYVVLKTHRLIT